jgi:hypothetical protein
LKKVLSFQEKTKKSLQRVITFSSRKRKYSLWGIKKTLVLSSRRKETLPGEEKIVSEEM